MSSVFRLHVIPSRKALDWSSPRSLLKCTLFNHLIQDQAPIGHFFIDIETKEANPFQAKRVVTGMSRLNKNQSTVSVIKEKVGLGSFFYDFAGKLDDAKDALQELEWAKDKKRLKTIEVKVSNERALELLQELDLWIKNGSFRHYSGGLSILKGEGSGCAEFGAHFLNLALGFSFVPKEWIRSVYAPKHLVGGHRTGKKVSLFTLFRTGIAWAKSEADGILYQTPDMDLTWNWLEAYAPAQTLIEFSSAAMDKVSRYGIGTTSEQSGPMESNVSLNNSGSKEPRISFQAGYANESESSVALEWSRVSFKA